VSYITIVVRSSVVRDAQQSQCSCGELIHYIRYIQCVYIPLREYNIFTTRNAQAHAEKKTAYNWHSEIIMANRIYYYNNNNMITYIIFFREEPSRFCVMFATLTKFLLRNSYNIFYLSYFQANSNGNNVIIIIIILLFVVRCRCHCTAPHRLACRHRRPKSKVVFDLSSRVFPSSHTELICYAYD